MYVAVLSAYEIQALVAQSFKGQSEMGDYIPLDVRRASGKVETLEVSFCRNYRRYLQGKTRDNELVMITLGPQEQRRHRTPNVMVSLPMDDPFNPCSSR